MRTRVLLTVAALVVEAAASAQLRITSFNSSGQLTWTNSVYRGLYYTEAGSTPAGPWTTFASVVDLDGAKTNRITLQVPLSNTLAFYRVAWIPPDAIGVWDYRGYDNQGTLVITGQLSLTSKTLITTNPPFGYNIQGSWNLQYAGPPTNTLQWLGPQIGTGYLAGTVELETAFLRLRWPTNVHDYNITLARDIWANTYTGQWAFVTVWPVSVGRFTATRMPAANAANTRTGVGEAVKTRDDVR